MESWKEKDLDLILTPTYPLPAISENMTGTLNGTLNNMTIEGYITTITDIHV